MKAIHTNYDDQTTEKPVGDSDAAQTPRVRKVLPVPGKPQAFEEALKASSAENKELLDRLAR